MVAPRASQLLQSQFREKVLLTRLNANGFTYLTDTDYPAVLRINPDGTIVRIAGDPNITFSKDGEGQTARFNRPTGINFDSQGNLLVCDGDLIRKITIQ